MTVSTEHRRTRLIMTVRPHYSRARTSFLSSDEWSSKSHVCGTMQSLLGQTPAYLTTPTSSQTVVAVYFDQLSTRHASSQVRTALSTTRASVLWVGVCGTACHRTPKTGHQLRTIQRLMKTFLSRVSLADRGHCDCLCICAYNTYLYTHSGTIGSKVTLPRR